MGEPMHYRTRPSADFTSKRMTSPAGRQHDCELNVQSTQCDNPAYSRLGNDTVCPLS